ncbi:MAG TPA: nucleotidyltransferase domain-containing protein [Stellaceae bacterium]
MRGTTPLPPVGPVEPAGPALREIAGWIAERLRGSEQAPSIEAAVLTGSVLCGDASSRSSDIDLSLFVRDDPADPEWIAFARRLRAGIPDLSVHIDRLAGFADRAPLLACRLRAEQLPLLGRIGEAELPWPSVRCLRSAGLIWAQQTANQVQQRLIREDLRVADPLALAWQCSKLCLDALRFRLLVRGGRTTDAPALVARVTAHPPLAAGWGDAFLVMYDIAREFRPPPADPSRAAALHVAVAIAAVRGAQDELTKAG